MSKEQINVGLLGFGVVGSGTYRVLCQNAELISQKVGSPVVITKASVRDISTIRDTQTPPNFFTSNPFDITDDPEIDIVCELIGGVSPAFDLVMRSISHNKSIVTANKEMIAKFGSELLRVASEANVDFSFEGSVGGGIPLIQPLKQGLAGNKFNRVVGIVNGTTNYILSKMTAEGSDFDDVLAEAQSMGYAEADPTNDVQGYDAQYKIAILSSIAFTSRVDPSHIYVEGIDRVSKNDIAITRELGYTIKLVGIGEDLGTALQVRVHPALIPNQHPLASVNGVYNAVFVHGDAVGDVMLYGRGAGSLPTGSAVVGDIIETARNIKLGATGRLGCTCFTSKPVQSIDSLQSQYYVRLMAQDRPKVLASIASVFGDFDVSIERVVQKALPNGDAEIVWITHVTLEANLRSALEVLKRLSIISSIENWIRVLDTAR